MLKQVRDEWLGLGLPNLEFMEDGRTCAIIFVSVVAIKLVHSVQEQGGGTVTTRLTTRRRS